MIQINRWKRFALAYLEALQQEVVPHFDVVGKHGVFYHKYKDLIVTNQDLLISEITPKTWKTLFKLQMKKNILDTIKIIKRSPFYMIKRQYYQKHSNQLYQLKDKYQQKRTVKIFDNAWWFYQVPKSRQGFIPSQIIKLIKTVFVNRVLQIQPYSSVILGQIELKGNKGIFLLQLRICPYTYLLFWRVIIPSLIVQLIQNLKVQYKGFTEKQFDIIHSQFLMCKKAIQMCLKQGLEHKLFQPIHLFFFKLQPYIEQLISYINIDFNMIYHQDTNQNMRQIFTQNYKTYVELDKQYFQMFTNKVSQLFVRRNFNAKTEIQLKRKIPQTRFKQKLPFNLFPILLIHQMVGYLNFNQDILSKPMSMPFVFQQFQQKKLNLEQETKLPHRRNHHMQEKQKKINNKESVKLKKLDFNCPVHNNSKNSFLSYRSNSRRSRPTYKQLQILFETSNRQLFDFKADQFRKFTKAFKNYAQQKRCDQFFFD